MLGRLVTGAEALGVLSALRRERLPRDPVAWAHLAVIAVLLCVAPFLAFAWAEQHISSGLASVYNVTTPLMTTLVALAALPAERPTPTRLVGLLTGFIGVLLVLAPWRGLGSGQILAQLACLAATASYGIAFVYLRRFIASRGLTALSTATVQVALAAVITLALTPLTATGAIQLTGAVVGSVLALGVLGTGIAFMWNTNVIAGWGATNAATYLTPVVGVALAAVVLGETPRWNEPIGTVIVILGIAIAHNRLTELIRPHSATTGLNQS